MTRFRVLLFARYAEVFGADAVEVQLRPDANVADLVTALRQLPGGDLLPAAPLLAVDRRQATTETRLDPAAEIALLPPLAGG